MPRVDCTGKNVDELLAGPYKEAVAAIKADPSVEAAIAKYKDENEEYGFLLDDLFILRYAISHTDEVPVAIKAIVSTLEWRHEHQDKLRPYHVTIDPETGKEVRRDPEELARDPDALRRWSQHLPGYNDFSSYGVVTVHGASLHGGPVAYARPGIANSYEAEMATDDEDIMGIFSYTKEPGYALCDHATRKTRLLVKGIAVADVKGLGYKSIPTKNFRRMLNETSKDTEMYYPQCVGKIIIVNVPTLLRVVIEGILSFMLKSLTDKVVFASPPSAKRIAAAVEKKKMQATANNNTNNISGDKDVGAGDTFGSCTSMDLGGSTASMSSTRRKYKAGGLDSAIFETYH